MEREDTVESGYKGPVFTRLMKYMRPYVGRMIVCVVMVTVLMGIEIYTPRIMGRTIDNFSTDRDYNVVLQVAALFVGLLVVRFVLDIAQQLILQKTGQQIMYNVRGELYDHIQHLSSRFFDLTPVGKLVTRVTNDVEALNEMYSGILIRLFRNVFKIIGLIVVMLFFDWRLACMSFVLMPVLVVLTILFERLSRKVHRVARARITDINTFLSEHISGMRIIQMFGREQRKYDEFEGKSHNLLKAQYNVMYVYGTFRPLIGLINTVALMIVLGFGARQVLNLAITAGTLFTFSEYIKQFYDPIQDLAEQFSTIQQSLASAEKIFIILDTETDVPDPENPVVLPQILGRIEFRHVWFAYDGDNYVLRDVSFTIEPGERVAFVGATGAGKTSILNLIGRYYDIQQGQILIDGVDIKEIDKKQLRRAIGQMQQDVFIYEGTVASNIKLYDDISDEEMRAAAEHVNAAPFIERLPDGYDTKVTERGQSFSAGERQLLSFARTLAHSPRILVMDEATANIDTETELLIQEALERLMAGRTTIMVAHRLSTIQHADMIYVMHHGKIREHGSHQELLAMNGIYKKLYELQVK